MSRSLIRNVVVLGGGVVGINSAKMAVGLGAKVTIFDINVHRLDYLSDVFGNEITTLHSNSEQIEKAVIHADLLIGAVLVPGAKAPKLVSNDLVSRMKPGSVLVDIAVDQGGCFADTRPTTPSGTTTGSPLCTPCEEPLARRTLCHTAAVPPCDSTGAAIQWHDTGGEKSSSERRRETSAPRDSASDSAIRRRATSR